MRRRQRKVLIRYLLAGTATLVSVFTVGSTPVTATSRVVGDGFLVLDARTGVTVATFSDARRTITPVGNLLIYESEGEKNVRNAQGQLLWSMPKGARVLAADSSDVAVADPSPDQMLLVRSATTGEARSPDGFGVRQPRAAAFDGRDLVVVGTRSGVTGPGQECPELAIVDRNTQAIRWSVPLKSATLANVYATVGPGLEMPPPPGLCADVAPSGLTVGPRVITLVGTNLLSFDRLNGQLLYAAPSSLGRLQPDPFPTYPMRRSLAAAGDLAIISSPTEVRAVDPLTRQVRWSHPADDYQGPVVGSGIVVARSGADLVVLDAATGVRRWSTTLPGDPSIVAGRVLFTSTRHLRAVTLRTGRLIWRRSFAGPDTRIAVIGATDTTVVVRTFQQRVVSDASVNG